MHRYSLLLHFIKTLSYNLKPQLDNLISTSQTTATPVYKSLKESGAGGEG